MTCDPLEPTIRRDVAKRAEDLAARCETFAGVTQLLHLLTQVRGDKWIPDHHCALKVIVGELAVATNDFLAAVDDLQAAYPDPLHRPPVEN